MNGQRIDAAQGLADSAAIGLSLVCSLHCLALPVAASLLPSVAALGLEDESYHLWMILGVIPFSAVALTLGCRIHRNYQVISMGVIGVFILCLAGLIGHEILGEVAERTLTLLGAVLIAISHLKNFKLCRKRRTCECVD